MNYRFDSGFWILYAVKVPQELCARLGKKTRGMKIEKVVGGRSG